MVEPVTQTHDMSGVWADVLTPLKADLTLDAPRFCAHIRNLSARGVAHFTVFGFAGEGPCFSNSEKLDALSELIKSGVSASDLMLGVTATAIADAVHLIKSAHALGVRRFLVAPPLHYQPIGQSAMLAFYQQLIGQVNLPHWQLYFHQLGGVFRADVAEATLAELRRQFPFAVTGIVDQDVHPSHTLDLMRSFGSQLIVAPTNEANLLVLKPSVTLSAMANLMPVVIKHILANDLPVQTTKISGMKIKSPDDRVTELRTIMGEQPLVASLKLFLSMHYRQTEWEWVRPPLMRISKDGREALMKAFKNFNLLASE